MNNNEEKRHTYLPIHYKVHKNNKHKVQLKQNYFKTEKLSNQHQARKYMYNEAIHFQHLGTHNNVGFKKGLHVTTATPILRQNVKNKLYIITKCHLLPLQEQPQEPWLYILFLALGR